MKNTFHTILLCTFLAIAHACRPGTEAELYVTTADQSMIFQQLTPASGQATNDNPIIQLNPRERYQTMDGFGAAMTGSSCYNLLRMTPENRSKLLQETFHPETGMGYSYIRISIGCSDFSLDEYTCCDQEGIENFVIHDYDKRDLLPILKEILAINPEIKILASPWTCPIWMKVNNLQDRQPFKSWTSGQLNPAYYQDYATYFVKYIQAMEREGIPIHAITIQNEPLNKGNSASLFMTWQEQRDFIKTALGPAFKKAGLNTQIIAYDHNYDYDAHKPECKDQIGYPAHLYADADAARYITGTAYHAYGGDKEEMMRLHQAYPEKGLYFTEISIGLWGNGYTFADDLMWNMREVCIGTINRFCKAVIVWNFMLDEKHSPYRPGGCNICLGAIDIQSSDYATMTRNSHYYTMAHLSKVIKPGATRIGVTDIGIPGIYYSAFENPDGSLAVVLQNDTEQEQTITLRGKNRTLTYTHPPKSVASYRWR